MTRQPDNVYVGVAGWSYPDWAGIVYPERRKRGFSELAHLSQFVDAVEVNSTFYRPAGPAMAENWLRQVEARQGFLFTAKLWQRFTHERALPWTAAEAETVRHGLQPLRQAGRLGAVLAQFPWSFRPDAGAFDWLDRLADEFRDFPVVVEVRHAEWNSDEAVGKLREGGLNFCNVDQPAFRTNLPPTGIATGPVGYCRFHGRNAQAWFAKDAGRERRYDYLYSENELAPWVERIARMAGETQKLFVMTNNHYRGQELVNALQMKSMLGGGRVAVPETLMELYPHLRALALPVEAQGRLGF
jgi:uncharacterized protein YecE (DUF72 family)